MFTQLGLKITASANMTVVDFLDVTFDIRKKEFKPFSKPGNPLLYVHAKSNHPPAVTKEIPHSIQTRLSNISSSKEVFDNAKLEYQRALAGCRLPNKPANTNPTPRAVATESENEKETFYGSIPPFSKSVQTNIKAQFFDILEKELSKGTPTP